MDLGSCRQPQSKLPDLVIFFSIPWAGKVGSLGSDSMQPLLPKLAADGLFPGGAGCSGEGGQPLGDCSALCLPR